MSSLRMVFRAARPSMAFARPVSTTSRRMAGPGNAQQHEGTEEHRKIQSEKPLNPHMTNTNSTIVNDMPSVGARKPPPEFLTSVDPDFVPKDSVPENTERMTCGTQKAPESGSNEKMETEDGERGERGQGGARERGQDGEPGEMGVGEMEGGTFKIEPLRRTGEDANTTRARLLCAYRRYYNALRF